MLRIMAALGFALLIGSIGDAPAQTNPSAAGAAPAQTNPATPGVAPAQTNPSAPGVAPAETNARSPAPDQSQLLLNAGQLDALASPNFRKRQCDRDVVSDSGDSAIR